MRFQRVYIALMFVFLLLQNSIQIQLNARISGKGRFHLYLTSPEFDIKLSGDGRKFGEITPLYLPLKKEKGSREWYLKLT